MTSTSVDTIEEYKFCLERGHDPLLSPYLPMKHELRVEVQKLTFGHCVIGRGDIPKANQRYYEYIWKNKPHICENCQKPLHNYSASFISHMFTKGGFPEMAHDPRNCNILCLTCHNKWEFGTVSEKIGMRIHPTNTIVMRELKKAYQH